MFRSKSPVIILAALLLSLPLRVSADEICAVERCSSDFAIRCFRGVAKKGDGGKELTGNALLKTFMRSNPSGGLECFRQQVVAAKSKGIQDLSAFSGVIGGDVKPDNVDIVKINGDWQIGLIDLDDGGWGSLLGDVFHTLTYNEVWEPRLTFDEALTAYLAGLKGEKLIDVPRIRSDSSPPGRSCINQEKKWKDKQKQKLDDHKIKPLKEASKDVKDLYEQDKTTFNEEIHKMGKSNDGSDHEGFEMKTRSGGSMCMPRFVYLVKDKDAKECDIVEFKLQRLPAAAVFSGGEADHEKRLASLIEYYRPSGDIGHLVKAEPVRGKSNKYYIARYDRNENFKATMDKRLDIGQFAKRHAYSKRMLHWLGQVHAQQNRAYATMFEETFQTNRANRDELKKMIDSHIAYMEERASKLPPYECRGQ